MALWSLEGLYLHINVYLPVFYMCAYQLMDQMTALNNFIIPRQELLLVYARNYRFYRNGNFLKGTKVFKIIGTTVGTRKKFTGFSRMSVTLTLLCFGVLLRDNL